jgi:hypothetical protein
MIDIESMCAAGRQLPVLYVAQCGQAGDENHGGVTDGKEDALGSSIGNAPPRPAGKIDYITIAVAA